MEWTDEAIVLGARRHGEGNAIAELMTQAHGRHLGLVRGGAGARLRPVLQPGNTVRATWRARLDEHLGHYALEGLRLRAAEFLPMPHAVFALSYLAALLRFLAERDPHPALYEMLSSILERISDARGVAALVVRFEIKMLADLGFGLDLSRCAATGAVEELVYVSPKSARAVSRSAGEAWRDRLFALPAFITDAEASVSTADLEAGFALSEFFLVRHVIEPRGEALPHARASFIAAVLRLLAASPRPEERS